MTENLALLQFSAAVSGVELVTLGVGKPWHGNRDKVLHYLAYLEQQESVRDDDVVVLIDTNEPVLALPHKSCVMSVVQLVVLPSSGQ